MSQQCNQVQEMYQRRQNLIRTLRNKESETDFLQIDSFVDPKLDGEKKEKRTESFFVFCTSVETRSQVGGCHFRTELSL